MGFDFSDKYTIIDKLREFGIKNEELRMGKAGKTILIILIILAVLAAGAFAVFNGVFSKMGKSSDLSYGADSPESAEALEKAEAEG